MQLDVLNFGFAWIAVILAATLVLVYLLRVMWMYKLGTRTLLGNWNRALRKHHKTIGIFLLLTGLVHGLASSEQVLSVNLGTVNWLVVVLLGMSWMFRKRLSGFKSWMFWHRCLTAAFILTLVLHIVDVGGIQVHRVLLGMGDNTQVTTKKDSEESPWFDTAKTLLGGTNEPITSNEPAEIFSTNATTEATEPLPTFDGVVLADGIYTGSANGYRPGLVVEVTVAQNQVTDIIVTDHNEVNSRYYSRPIQLVPGEIVDVQSLDVDTISGATFTSIGIINAVNEALSQAVISGELPELKSLPTIRRRH